MPLDRLSKRFTLTRLLWTGGLVAALALGAVFRLLWLQDIEYKGDEAWTAAQVHAYLASGHLPLLGMPSSAGLPNAGLSLWIFLVIGRLLGTADPLALSRAVQVLNVAALLLLAGFALRMPRTEREPWLWSAALVAVDPLTVLFQRKLWPPSVFPLFTLTLLLGWWQRRLWWGAFLWGLLGMLLGQIELGGFFFAAGFVLTTLLLDRRGVRWTAWSAGTLLGALPLLPWVQAVLADGGARGGLVLPSPAFFLDWINLALGLDLGYSLGRNLPAFLAWSPLGGGRGWIPAALMAAIFALFAMLVLRLSRRLRASPAPTRAALFDATSPAVLAISAALWGYGLLLTLSLRPIYLHYLIVAFALPALSLAWIARAGSRDDAGSRASGRVLLAGLTLAQALLTMTFLTYIHQTRIIDGDYGTVYGAQPR